MRVLQNAPFHSQIFKKIASGGKGALAPLTKILRTFLSLSAVKFCVVLSGRDVKTLQLLGDFRPQTSCNTVAPKLCL